MRSNALKTRILALIEADISSYDFKHEVAWVHDMASDRIGPQPLEKDKRVKGVANQLEMLPICPITLGVYAK